MKDFQCKVRIKLDQHCETDQQVYNQFPKCYIERRSSFNTN